jgi:D-alanyl-D-alanine carboxypeptidase (penicillin-binding protein 5/6)
METNQFQRRKLNKAASLSAASMALALCALLIATGTTWASYRRHYRRHVVHHRYWRPRHVPLYHALLLEDAETGQILYDYNGGIQWPPASMAKMMLLLVVEDQLKAGRVHLEDPVTISAKAAHTGGSTAPLRPGEVFSLRSLMRAALIHSANDAAVAIAQYVCGSTARCVDLMNAKARQLGMTHTLYHTVEGLPPRPLHDVDTTDAYDLAKLARVIIYRTDLLRWSRLATTTFDHGHIILHNTNHLIGHYKGCDGLKTGFTFKAGFNLTATAKRGKIRLIAVVLGAPNNFERFAQAARLMTWGFDNFEKVTVIRHGELLPVHVRVGTAAEREMMQPVAKRTVTVLVRKKEAKAIKIDYAVPENLYGPLAPDQTVGHVIVRDRNGVLAECAAICPFPVGQQPPPAITPVKDEKATGAAGLPALSVQAATTQTEDRTR